MRLPHSTVPHIVIPADFKAFGAPDHATYTIWKKEVCGIAALKSVTDFLGLTLNLSLHEMTMFSLEYGVFKIFGDIEKPGAIKGAFHDGLLRFAKSLGVRGFRAEFIPPQELLGRVERGWLAIASVNVTMLWEDVDSPRRNHLVLVVGFERNGREITTVYYKDSATSLKWNRETDQVPMDRFERAFNGRAVFLQAS